MSRQARMGGYGLIGYYGMPFLLLCRSPDGRLRWMRDEIRLAIRDGRDDRRGRRLLHLTDLPIDLGQNANRATHTDSRQKLQECRPDSTSPQVGVGVLALIQN